MQKLVDPNKSEPFFWNRCILHYLDFIIGFADPQIIQLCIDLFAVIFELCVFKAVAVTFLTRNDLTFQIVYLDIFIVELGRLYSYTESATDVNGHGASTLLLLATLKIGRSIEVIATDDGTLSRVGHLVAFFANLAFGFLLYLFYYLILFIRFLNLTRGKVLPYRPPVRVVRASVTLEDISRLYGSFDISWLGPFTRITPPHYDVNKFLVITESFPLASREQMAFTIRTVLIK